MPRGDGTGPMGMGPMTGRGMGYCAGFCRPGYAGAFGVGRGRGFGRMYRMTGLPGWARYGAQPHGYAPYAFEDAAPVASEKEFLQNQAAFLEKELKSVRERLDDIDETD